MNLILTVCYILLVTICSGMRTHFKRATIYDICTHTLVIGMEFGLENEKTGKRNNRRDRTVQSGKPQNAWGVNFEYLKIFETEIIKQIGMKEKEKSTSEKQENFLKSNFTAEISSNE